MSATEGQKARAFFADLLLPLKRANMRRDVRYLNCVRSADSYWGSIASRTGGVERLSNANCGGASLIGRLGRHWERQNDRDLPKLLPHLLALRQEIIGSPLADDEGETPEAEFVYPLF